VFPRALLVLLIPAILSAAAAKPRVLVLTDISSLTAGIREPDDGQSLIRFLLFSNEFDVEGIVATSNMRHGQTVRPELVRQAIDAYAQVWPNLRRHATGYPDPAQLRARVKSGQPAAGPQVPIEQSVGEGKDTEGSRWIISAASKPGKRPLWILIWGGSTDLAQALWRTRDNPALRSKLRVHAIYDQDAAAPWIRKTFPDLSYIVRRHGVRGMYRGGDMSLVSSQWVETNIRTGHGPLGALYPNYNGGDIWSSRLGRVQGIKEGDTPSFLGLIGNGLNLPDRLDLGGWGGRVVNFEDAADTDVAAPDDPDPLISAVYRWRGASQADFQARLDWCVRSPAEANHPPKVKLKVNGRQLDARGSTDPDGGTLTYEWLIYPPPPSSGPPARIQANGATASVVLPPGMKSTQVVLSVRDSGNPPLTRYGRAEVR